MAKLILTDITSSFASQNALQSNFDDLEAAIENTLSRDGTTPNQMEADLDMNSNNINNIGTLDVNQVTVNGENLVPATKVPDWEGAWTTATAYAVDDLVRESGNVYIALEAHTSGTFSTDLAANKWELFVSSGSSGAGSGDLLAANNLSDVDNPDTSLANLGGGTTGIALFKDTSAADARTELGLGALAVLGTVGNSEIDNDAVDMDKIADAVVVTEGEGINSNDNDTTLPTSAAVKDYVDSNSPSSNKAILAAEYPDSATPPEFQTTWTALELNTERYDGLGLTLASNQITIPTAGTYRIYAHIIAYNASGGGRNVQIRVYNTTDLTAVYGGSNRGQSAASSFNTVDAAITVAANDIIQIQGITNGVNVETFYSTADGGNTGLQVVIEKLS